MEFPRTMTSGVFKGRRFKSWGDYQKALRTKYPNGVPNRKTNGNGKQAKIAKAKRTLAEPEIHVHLIITSAGDIKVVKA